MQAYIQIDEPTDREAWRQTENARYKHADIEPFR